MEKNEAFVTALRDRGTILGLVTTEVLGQALELKTGTLENWRYLNVGPAYIRTGPTKGKVRYHISDVLAWLAQLRVPTGECD